MCESINDCWIRIVDLQGRTHVENRNYQRKFPNSYGPRNAGARTQPSRKFI